MTPSATCPIAKGAKDERPLRKTRRHLSIRKTWATFERQYGVQRRLMIFKRNPLLGIHLDTRNWLNECGPGVSSFMENNPLRPNSAIKGRIVNCTLARRLTAFQFFPTPEAVFQLLAHFGQLRGDARDLVAGRLVEPGNSCFRLQFFLTLLQLSNLFGQLF